MKCGNKFICAFSSIVVITISIFLWWLLSIQEDRYILVSTRNIAERVENEIDSQMAERLNALRRMVHRWQTIPGIDNDEWVRDASYLVQDQPGYSWILRTGKDGWIDWTIAAPARPGREPKPDVLSMPGAMEEIAKAVRHVEANELKPFSPPDLPPGRDMFLIVMPQMLDNEEMGAIVAGLDSVEFFDAILPPEMTRGYVLSITRHGRPGQKAPLYTTRGPGLTGVAKFSTETTAGADPIYWDITVAPTALKVAAERSSLPNIVLFSGILIALLLGYAIRQRQIANQREAMASRLGRIMNQSSNEIYFFDADTLLFVNINEGALKNLGYDQSEVTRMHPYDLKPDFSEASFRKLIAPLLEGKKTQMTFNTRHQRKDGTTYPVEVNLQISRDELAPLFFAVVQDLSERKRAEYERQRYMAMINHNRDLIAVVDPETLKFTFVNNGAVNAIGYSQEELMEMGPEDLRPEGSGDEFREMGQKVLSGEADLKVYDIQYKKRDGSLLDLEVHLMPIIDFDGKKALLGIGRDITERKKNQAELERARSELERRARDLLRSNQELQQFAYAASHDLQEPLRMISSYLLLLEEEYDSKLDEEAREYIRFAVDGANRMRDLIYDLLAFSQIETQGKPFTNVDCNRIMDTVLSDLSNVINESGVMITYESLPTVRGDFGQLVQIFSNLIGNAVKYRSPDEPKIRIDSKRINGMWEITISDNGIGIDEKFHQKIFEIFKRLHTHEEYQGTGIGLALCKRIIDRHDGKIGVRSNPDGGCQFYFTLHAVEKDEAPSEADKALQDMAETDAE